MEFKNQIIWFIILALSYSVNASPVDSLIDNYDFDFSTDEINLILIEDYMTDENFDALNDSFHVNITLDQIYPASIAMLRIDSGPFIYGEIESENIIFTITSDMLIENQFNYFIDIRDNNYSLLLRKKFESNFYEDYEKGIEIISIDDFKNEDNNLVFEFSYEGLINPESKEVIVYFNDILIKNELDFESSDGLVRFEVPAEKVASSHHKGVFKLDYIVIENKKINLNYTSNPYDFEDFSTRSYIKNFEFEKHKNNLGLSLFLNVLENQHYWINLEVYDSKDNLIKIINHSEFFEIGPNQLDFNLSSKELYNGKHSGPYKVKASIFDEENLIDIVPGHFISENFAYFDFENFELADLSLENVSLEGNLRFSVLNLGNEDARNISSLIYAEGNEIEFNIPILREDESLNFEFNLSLDKAILFLDHENKLDELNETNNFIFLEEREIKSTNKQLSSNLLEIIVNSNQNLEFFNIIVNGMEQILSKVFVGENYFYFEIDEIKNLVLFSKNSTVLEFVESGAYIYEEINSLRVIELKNLYEIISKGEFEAFDFANTSYTLSKSKEEFVYIESNQEGQEMRNLR